jgi:hypothetical protein
MKFAIVKTKSNFRNLNGRRLKVVEEFPNFIACKFFDEGRIWKADFGRSEIVKIWEPVKLNHFIEN